ncbi:hypothetical protein KVP09_08800, partial [Alcaligenaceae bacterium CGII-47]|nr:hypothetical protein [Alcaligenaceae bacterium CGII-47]
PPSTLFPPVQRKMFHEHVLDEILQERVAQRCGRRNLRAIKRKMSGWPVRRPHTKPLESIILTDTIQIIK